MESSTTDNATLKATYKTPNDEVTFSHNLGVPSAGSSDKISTSDKTAHLNALRASVTKLQDDVNVLLTKKMGEDKAAAAAAGVADPEKRKVALLDDEKEEENYGEEVVEDN